MDEVRYDFISAIAAGALIAIGAAVNLTIGGIAGAALFCVGLAAILYFGFSLYTGKAGLLLWGAIPFYRLMMIWVGNWVGASAAGFLLWFCNPDLSVAATELWQTRLSMGIRPLFFKSVFCGMLMYIAVTSYKKTEKIEFVILPVMVFILAGFCHSIADMAYASIASIRAIELWPLLIVSFGNLIGCNILAMNHTLVTCKAPSK